MSGLDGRAVVRYSRIFAARRRGRLEDGATRGSVSRDCRDAAVGFIAGVGRGWDKRDLALWLIGPYAYATRHVARGERTARPGQHIPSTMEERVEMLQKLDEIMTDTRERTLAVLVRASGPENGGAIDIACDLVEQGFVRVAEDASGTEVWVPVDMVRMRLHDRVAALLVADYLNDPIQYGRLVVCSRCERVAFEASEMCPHELYGVARAS